MLISLTLSTFLLSGAAPESCPPGGLVALLQTAPGVSAASRPVAPARSAAARLPERVFVRPVFLVPSDAEPPSDEYKGLLMRHLVWAQRRYREMLFDRDTFSLAPGELPFVLRSKHDLAFYKRTSDGGAEEAVLELFEHDRVDRFSCPYIYIVVFCGTGDQPKGGGRPFNGGVNTGGGIVVLAADNLLRDAGFQSTLQHELGHGFGLVHADQNGLDMQKSDSLMSYNPAHHSNGFEPSPTPGRLLPEDLRLLGYNKRAFPNFNFNRGRDVPPEYKLNSKIAILGAMSIRGQPEYKGTWNGEL